MKSTGLNFMEDTKVSSAKVNICSLELLRDSHSNSQ